MTVIRWCWQWQVIELGLAESTQPPVQEVQVPSIYLSPGYHNSDLSMIVLLLQSAEATWHGVCLLWLCAPQSQGIIGGRLDERTWYRLDSEGIARYLFDMLISQRIWLLYCLHLRVAVIIRRNMWSVVGLSIVWIVWLCPIWRRLYHTKFFLVWVGIAAWSALWEANIFVSHRLAIRSTVIVVPVNWWLNYHQA